MQPNQNFHLRVWSEKRWIRNKIRLSVAGLCEIAVISKQLTSFSLRDTLTDSAFICPSSKNWVASNLSRPVLDASMTGTANWDVVPVVSYLVELSSWSSEDTFDETPLYRTDLAASIWIADVLLDTSSSTSISSKSYKTASMRVSKIYQDFVHQIVLVLGKMHYIKSPIAEKSKLKWSK